MITINGVKWEIRFVSPTHSSLKRSDGVYALGCCNDIDKTIYITNDIKDFYMKKVLCHELTHAAMFSYDIYLSCEQEELVADIIATYGDEIIHMANDIFIRLKEQKKQLKGEHLK